MFRECLVDNQHLPFSIAHITPHLQPTSKPLPVPGLNKYHAESSSEQCRTQTIVVITTKLRSLPTPETLRRTPVTLPTIADHLRTDTTLQTHQVQWRVDTIVARRANTRDRTNANIGILMTVNLLTATRYSLVLSPC